MGASFIKRIIERFSDSKEYPVCQGPIARYKKCLQQKYAIMGMIERFLLERQTLFTSRLAQRVCAREIGVPAKIHILRRYGGMKKQTILTFKPQASPAKSAIFIFVGIIKNDLCGLFNGIKQDRSLWLKIGTLRQLMKGLYKEIAMTCE